jgi:hypothetical protein
VCFRKELIEMIGSFLFFYLGWRLPLNHSLQQFIAVCFLEDDDGALQLPALTKISVHLFLQRVAAICRQDPKPSPEYSGRAHRDNLAKRFHEHL